MRHPRFLPFVSALIFAALPVSARNQCPAALGAAVRQQFPHATLRSCVHTGRVGKQDQFQASLDSRDDFTGEIDLNSAGKIVRVDRSIDVEALPDMVYAAFTTQYRNRNIDAAKRRIDGAGNVSYVINFEKRGREREAVFTANGLFLGEG